MKTETLLPKTLTFPSGIVMVQDAFRDEISHAVFPKKEKNWTEFFQKMVDGGQVGKR